jgi:hypothetical protein
VDKWWIDYREKKKKEKVSYLFFLVWRKTAVDFLTIWIKQSKTPDIRENPIECVDLKPFFCYNKNVIE